jgi:hypothetical protein
LGFSFPAHRDDVLVFGRRFRWTSSKIAVGSSRTVKEIEEVHMVAVGIDDSIFRAGFITAWVFLY